MGFRTQFTGQAVASGASMTTALTVGIGTTNANLFAGIAANERLRVYRAILSGAFYMRAAAAAISEVSMQINLYETSGAFDQIGQLDIFFAEENGQWTDGGWAVVPIDLPRGVVLPAGAGIQLQTVSTLRGGSTAPQNLRAAGNLAIYSRIEAA